MRIFCAGPAKNKPQYELIVLIWLFFFQITIVKNSVQISAEFKCLARIIHFHCFAVAPPPTAPAEDQQADAAPREQEGGAVREADAAPQQAPQAMDAQGGFVDADDDDEGFGVGGFLLFSIVLIYLTAFLLISLDSL